ncbi:hypothetical protein PsorP6_001323 [Peronosclerospora sorghi]|uniref:Uncharacterized protein n=1 Tax=Peronosclerospora sorghi TaxID=230839 RepID=A0ACC0WTL9_9STRA|nr:hypothetical protein PsorP6_001323 [Peronosclerospora sorghi]
MGAITDHRNKFYHVEYLDVAIKDNVDVEITQDFGPTIEFIQKAADVGGRVLLHCVQGVSRSSTVCICLGTLQDFDDVIFQTEIIMIKMIPLPWGFSRRFQSLIPTMIIHTDDTNNKYDDDMDVVDDLAHLMQPLKVMVRTLEPDLSASLCFHKKIIDLLIAWGTCQLDALLIETPSEKYMALLGSISRNLCKLFAHPSIIASEAQIVLWLSVLKNKMIIPRGKPFVTDILEQLRQLYESYSNVETIYEELKWIQGGRLPTNIPAIILNRFQYVISWSDPKWTNYRWG